MTSDDPTKNPRWMARLMAWRKPVGPFVLRAPITPREPVAWALGELGESMIEAFASDLPADEAQALRDDYRRALEAQGIRE